MRDRSLGWLLAFLAASFGAATLGGLSTARSVGGWYRTIRKPSWNPPDWVFGPVWTVLYAGMAVSAWLVRREARRDPRLAGAASLALGAWVHQLILNVAWSYVFFGRRQIGGGVAVIAALWQAIAETAILSIRVSRPAGLLLLPYLAWTTFAGALNYRVWRLNRSEAAGRAT